MNDVAKDMIDVCTINEYLDILKTIKEEMKDDQCANDMLDESIARWGIRKRLIELTNPLLRGMIDDLD